MCYVDSTAEFPEPPALESVCCRANIAHARESRPRPSGKSPAGCFLFAPKRTNGLVLAGRKRRIYSALAMKASTVGRSEDQHAVSPAPPTADLTRFQGLNLKFKAMIWPRMSHVCHVCVPYSMTHVRHICVPYSIFPAFSMQASAVVFSKAQHAVSLCPPCGFGI